MITGIQIIDVGPRIVKVITKTCVACGDTSDFLLDRNAVERWQAGEHAQDVFTSMSVDDRETLISGTHPKCWGELFGVEE